MNKLAALLISLLLLSLVATQDTCGVSSLNGIASGLIILGAPTSAIAQTSYSQSLAGFNLGTFDTVFSAFAIAGIQASSTQQYYSLIVDQVIFSNGNTLMNITLVYANPTGTFQTTWSRIKLSWVAISTAFPTVVGAGGSYAWAGSVGMSYPFTSGIAGPVMPNSIWGQLTAGMLLDAQCGYVNPTSAGGLPAFDMTCLNAADPVFVTHLYIMGFQFNPTGGSYTLAASVLRNSGTTTSLADTDESQQGFTRNLNTNAAVTLTGPNMLIQMIPQLAYIKVGIVITTILARNTYPATNPTTFQYAGVYMSYSLFNVAQPVVQGARVLGNQNINYFAMLNHKYQIFGLSQFYINTLPSSVTVLNYDVDLTGVNTALVNTDDVNYMNGVLISADEWNANINACNPVATNMQNIAQKYLTSVPPIQTGVQTIYETSSALTFNYFAQGSTDPASPLSTNVVYTNTLFFQNITPGMTYEIDFSLGGVTLPLEGGNPFQIQYSLTVEGNQLLNNVTNVTSAAGPFFPVTHQIFPIRLGYIFQTATPAITITLNLPRGSVAGIDRTATTTLAVVQYSKAYNPPTDCCVTMCPPNNGISLGFVGVLIGGIQPTIPYCVACTAGLIYNSNLGQCQCQTGYYSVTQSTGQVQCFPCFAPLCQSCLQATNTVCSSCVTGAAVNSTTGLCQCLTGFFQNGSSCAPCPYQCGACAVLSVCSNCSDPITRSLNNSCACNAGFFDAGVAQCATCPSLCATCSSATNCTSCFVLNNRTLVNGQCVCATGFYQVANPNGTLTCAPCDPSCTTCSLLPTQCTNCDAAANRILGYDSFGNMVCNCMTGYSANSNGQCVQSNCQASMYCATCLTVLGTSTCIKCIAATFRTLVYPSQLCLCSLGYYDLNGACVPCSPGCQNCTSATSCSACVVSAQNNNNGSCTCPIGFFFTTSPIRFCKKCANYTLTCTSLTNATTCQTNFTLNNGICTCPSGNYINPLGQCVPCVANCATCNSSTNCFVCLTPYYLQSTICVSRCGPGFYQNGYVCSACSPGCASCSGPNICLICQAGRLSYNGFCYNNCPPGSVANTSALTCVDCNSPCGNCT